jgi:periplasmic protein TonB
MFDHLVSSHVTRRISPARGLLVGMVHGLVIAGAIRVTERPPDIPSAPVDRVMIYEHLDRPTARPVSPADAPADPIGPYVLPRAPVDVSIDLPPVNPGPIPNPDLLRRIVSAGTIGAAPADGDSVSMQGVLAAAQVDEPAVVLHQPSPRYPPVLQQAGIEGRVLLEFVIDTAGHMETESLRVLETSNPGFNAAAGETVRRSIFRAARVHGGAVRQRTIQSIAFRIVP